MNEDKVRQMLEEIDPEGKISSDKREEIVVAFKEMEVNPPRDGETRNGMTFSVLEKEKEIKRQLSEETDWRKKAALAAQLISNGLS